MIKFFIFINYANVLLFLIYFFTISMRQFRILLDCFGKIGFYLKQINKMNHVGIEAADFGSLSA